MTATALPDIASLSPPDRRSLIDLLVFATSAASRPDRFRRSARTATSDAPLDRLTDAADLHRVAGTVGRGLDGINEVPEAVFVELDRRRQQASLRHVMTMGALSQIGSAFDDAGLAWVVMKGPVLASHLYPDVGDRSYGDLDLLVHGPDFGAAMELLESFGYQHDIHNWALTEQMLAGAVGMTSPMTNVDLHWHLHYSQEDRGQFDLDPAELIGRSRRIEVSGMVVPTFDEVDTLITLGFHAARSGGHRLIWLKDIERSLAVDEPDLDELVRRCRRYRCAAPVGLMLNRSRILLGADVPDEIIDALLPSSLRSVDALLGRVRPRVRLDERETSSRWLSRSVRDSLQLRSLPCPSVRDERRFVACDHLTRTRPTTHWRNRSISDLSAQHRAGHRDLEA